MSTAIAPGGVLPDVRLARRDAMRRELAAADRLEVEAARWREHADELGALVRSRTPRALSVDLLPTAQRLRLRGADRWVPKVPAAVKAAAAPAPVVDPVAAFMHQPELHEDPVWSRLRGRAVDLALAVVALLVVPRRVTTSPAVREVEQRRELLAPLAVPGPRRRSRWSRLVAWADDWAEWLKPSQGAPHGVRRAGS